MDNSYIKLYRSLLSWEWWDDKNVTRLFMTILLSVNWQPKKWHGMTIEPGSMFTSLDHLSKKSGLTLSQTRTALFKLKSTGEIASKTTSNGQLITVENWEKFQIKSEQLASKIASNLTGKSQTDDKQIANESQQLKNIKNIKKDNNLRMNSSSFLESLNDDELEQIKSEFEDPEELIQAAEKEARSRERNILLPYRFITGYAIRNNWKRRS